MTSTPFFVCWSDWTMAIRAAYIFHSVHQEIMLFSFYWSSYDWVVHCYHSQQLHSWHLWYSCMRKNFQWLSYFIWLYVVQEGRPQGGRASSGILFGDAWIWWCWSRGTGNITSATAFQIANLPFSLKREHRLMGQLLNQCHIRQQHTWRSWDELITSSFVFACCNRGSVLFL